MKSLGEAAGKFWGNLALKLVLNRKPEGDVAPVESTIPELVNTIAVDVKSLNWPGHWDGPREDMSDDGAQTYYKIVDGTQVFANFNKPTFLKTPSGYEFKGAEKINGVDGMHNNGNYEFKLDKNGHLAKLVLEGPLVPGADAEHIDVDEFAIEKVIVEDFEKPEVKVNVKSDFHKDSLGYDGMQHETKVQQVTYICDDSGKDGAGITKEIEVAMKGWESAHHINGVGEIILVLKRNDDDEFDLYVRDTNYSLNEPQLEDRLLRREGKTATLTNFNSKEEMKIDASQYSVDDPKCGDTKLSIQIGSHDALELWLPTISVKDVLKKAAKVSGVISSR